MVITELSDSTTPEERLKQLEALLSVTDDIVANAANLSAFLFEVMDEVNWVGFYFHKGGELVVGPFQGRPACVLIPVGKGVCGKAAETLQIQRVGDVDVFEGHIACDAESRSEIVLPLVKDGRLLGVLDLDSPVRDRFSRDDQEFLEQVTQRFLQSIR